MRPRSGLCIIVLLLTAARAGAQVDCGAVLGPGGSFVATDDVGPCVEDPAVTIVGPVEVDFAGFRVACELTASNEGIVIEGKGAKVSNGSVTNCELGVRVAGEGRHVLVQMSAEDNEGRGFVVDSDGNKLEHNLAFRNGEGSTFSKGVSSANSGTAAHGYYLNGAVGAKLSKGVAVGNEGSGYGSFSSAHDFTISKALALGNAQNGIEILGGSTGNTIKGSTAIGNGNLDLFDGNVDCDMNTWSKNRFGHATPAACIE